MTTSLVTIPDELAFGGELEQKAGSWWATPSGSGPLAVAEALLARGARFVSITATELPDDGGLSLDYHWDLDSAVLTYTFMAEDKRVESIFSICEAANWIEREIREYYAVEFIGRVCDPLFLREDQNPGVNMHEVEE
ncbi:MAG: NADH-quinone oxidoreductase subunit C [Terracidiphilus sp.]|nr:NADH-quinone oxidoreductase subunit C [Terracidiphilus sp.]